MKILLILIFSLLVFTSCWERKEVRIVQKIMQETIFEVKTKYDLHFVGISQGYEQKKYNELGLTFQSYRKLDREEGRKMLLDVIQIFLKNINNSPEIQFYSFTWPYTEKNIGVGIINPKIDISDTADDNIFSFNLRVNKIVFDYRVPGTEYGFRCEIETLEEAKRLASENKK